MPPPLLLLGGTFDPPHIGHLFLAECTRAQFGGRVVFLPAGDPWRKTTGAVGGRRELTPAALRLEMVRLAVRGNRAFSVDDREVRRAGPSYTVDTLRELRAEGDADLVLIVGSDALADMPNWREAAAIPELARVAVALKAGAEVALPAWATAVEMPPLPVSSTLIRSRAAAGLPIRYLVPEPVRRFIAREGLYRA
ncbi:MAG: nicotinate-nucleotide adenylyltransferase [Dehalococcoidia bacterium]